MNDPAPKDPHRAPTDPDPSVQVAANVSRVHSGEIVETRARIIRVSGPQAVPSHIQQETTEKTRSTPVAKRTTRLPLLVAAMATLVGGVALLVASRPAGKPDVSVAEAAAEMLATALDSESKAAVLRVEAIAASPMVRAAIETDAATLEDMEGDDLVFPVKEEMGEVLEVFQHVNGARESLFRKPEDAAQLDPPKPGSARINICEKGKLGAVASAAVVKQKAGIGGEIVMAVPIDLVPTAKRFNKQLLGATLTGLKKPVVLFGDPKAAGVEVKVPVKPRFAYHNGDITLTAVVARPVQNGTLRLAGYTTTGLAVVLFALWVTMLLRRRRTA